VQRATGTPFANALPIRQRVIVENDSALVGCQSV
jgi:hypothetical protein